MLPSLANKNLKFPMFIHYSTMYYLRLIDYSIIGLFAPPKKNNYNNYGPITVITEIRFR